MKRFIQTQRVRRAAWVACSILTAGSVVMADAGSAAAGGCGRPAMSRGIGGFGFPSARSQFGSGYSAPVQHRVHSAPSYSSPSHLVHGQQGSVPYGHSGHVVQPSHVAPQYLHPSHGHPSHGHPSHGQPSHAQSAPGQFPSGQQTFGQPVSNQSTFAQAAPGQQAFGQPPQSAGQPNQVGGDAFALGGQAGAGAVRPSETSGGFGNDEQSALRMLESIGVSAAAGQGSGVQDEFSGIPAFTSAPVAQQAVANHVGVWQAKLPNQAAVVLDLRADGTFRWVATSGGKTSSFDGRYQMRQGRLSLIRSNDSGELSGSWTANSNNAGANRFKVDSSNDDGLAFVKVSGAGV